jgi:hypothetical protein
LLTNASIGTPECTLQLNLPSANDVAGAAKALMFLQTTYQLETHDLANGNLPGLPTPVAMTGA